MSNPGFRLPVTDVSAWRPGEPCWVAARVPDGYEWQEGLFLRQDRRGLVRIDRPGVPGRFRRITVHPELVRPRGGGEPAPPPLAVQDVWAARQARKTAGARPAPAHALKDAMTSPPPPVPVWAAQAEAEGENRRVTVPLHLARQLLAALGDFNRGRARPDDAASVAAYAKAEDDLRWLIHLTLAGRDDRARAPEVPRGRLAPPRAADAWPPGTLVWLAPRHSGMPAVRWEPGIVLGPTDRGRFVLCDNLSPGRRKRSSRYHPEHLRPRVEGGPPPAEPPP